MKKYEVDRTAYSDGRMPNNDIVLYRYADVLLMKSEAKAFFVLFVRSLLLTRVNILGFA